MRLFFNNFYKNLFFSERLSACCGIAVVLYLIAFFFPGFSIIPVIFFYATILLLLLDIVILYRSKEGITALRITPDRLSNGDENEIHIQIENHYPFRTQIGVIDEIPVQFQKRDAWFELHLESLGQQSLIYSLRPTRRGEYEFGAILIYVQSPLSFVKRRYRLPQIQTLPVYPSFLQLRKYELMAISNRLTEVGVKKVRRLGNSMEFDQIKNYVAGNDYRTINWRATARRGDLMVNTYIEEKSQHLYCIIDKSRVMKMPFEGLSLLDYAINASLVLSRIALLKEDKTGLITISDQKSAVVPADGKLTHLNKIVEALYREKTRYLESNIELLYATIRNTAKQRSLLVFFTNFESLSALKRQLPLLKQIAKFHLLIIVFFENTELLGLSKLAAANVEEIYTKTVINKFVYDKKLIVKELARNGIQSILTTPQNLTVNTINKYLEIKANQKI